MASAAQGRILHIVREAAYGATESVCELALHLPAYGVDVQLLSLVRPDDDPGPGLARVEAAGIPVTRVPIRMPASWMRPEPLYRLGDIRRIRRAVERIEPELIHCHESLGLAAARGASAPAVVTVHGATGKNPLYEHLFRRLCAGVDARIVLTQADLRSFAASARDTVLLRNAVDSGWWRAACDRAVDLRPELEIPSHVFVIGLVGRLSPEKGTEPFLRAFARRQAHSGSRTCLLIAGCGPREARLRRLCDRLDLHPITRFVGRRHDMPRVYRTTDLVALPSRRETQPMVVLEALACGVPVVATAAGEVPAMLAGGAGRVVPMRDLHGMLEAIESLIASKVQRGSLIDRGRLRVASLYDSGGLAREVVDRVYARLLP